MYSSSNATYVFDLLKRATTGDATFYNQQIIDWESICSFTGDFTINNITCFVTKLETNSAWSHLSP